MDCILRPVDGWREYAIAVDEQGIDVGSAW
jgi:hypothetical protein